MRVLEWFSNILVSICLRMQNKRGVIWPCTPLTFIHRKGTPPTQYVNLADPWTGPSL
jgi:hypothetical protein